ncbi:hypothetical protein QFC21_000559 [Naganishia friedmannii]|uniref:Uncharacterized protein n=1 Tax=Naganishia friedmannii TaxID=89922 RepID=A0ACC2WDM0_9TREE|nr:hypothetical protein QFC21_000559 [Naganishia friedmannii]
MTSIWVPFAYITVLVGGMLMFSRYLRRQKQAKISATEPWFPTHQARDLYITLLQQQDPPAEEKILMAALLCRAVTDVKRIWQLRDSKNALNILVQKGSLGDETVARFAAAEKELEAEVVDVVAEANTFREGWGQWIFASASEVAQREKLRGLLEGLPKIKQEQDRICASLKATSTKSAAASTSTPTNILPPSTTPNSSSISTSTSIHPALLASSTEGLVNRVAPASAAAAAVASIAQDLTEDTEAEAEQASGSGASTPGGSGVMTPVKGAGGATKGTPGSSKKRGKRK